MRYPARHRTRLHGTGVWERLNTEVKRRADVVGILQSEDAIAGLIGALFRAEQRVAGPEPSHARWGVRSEHRRAGRPEPERRFTRRLTHEPRPPSWILRHADEHDPGVAGDATPDSQQSP
jgi:hypothetical protein